MNYIDDPSCEHSPLVKLIDLIFQKAVYFITKKSQRNPNVLGPVSQRFVRATNSLDL